jgi:hypothetical protein
MSKLVNVKFKCPYNKFKLEVKNLRSRGGSDITLPFMDYNTMKPLEDSKQILEGLFRKEADDLMRCWPGLFEEIKPVEKKRKEENECLDINQQ